MSKENQRVALSKRLLKEGVMKLLKKKSIGDITVTELCNAAEINRTTFYRHYQTPHDVLLEIEFDFVKKLQGFPLSSAAADDVKKHASRMCGFLFENRDIVKIFLKNSTESDIGLIYQNFYDSFLQSRQILYKGRSVSNETLQLLKEFFACGIYAIVRKWITEDMPLTPEEAADLIAGAFNKDFTFQ